MMELEVYRHAVHASAGDGDTLIFSSPAIPEEVVHAAVLAGKIGLYHICFGELVSSIAVPEVCVHALPVGIISGMCFDAQEFFFQIC